MSWAPVIGLEVHAQLATRTKLFCGCAYEFGAEPNTRTCPVCTGQPGALPVLNAEAVALAVRAALLVDGHVALRSRFDRKNYFYCDLPKGYQITQYDEPYCTGGHVELSSGKRIRLERIHLEEDAGKAIHDRGPRTLVDLNRAGVPLIESVTGPDLASAEEAVEYLEKLRERFAYAGVSDADMEKGNLRCDVNVSVRQGDEPLRTKVELKNLNSFRNVAAAIEYEVQRQVQAYEAGEAVVQETRLYDVDAGVTRTMRTKEDEADYRYFPEPDLPQLALDEAFVEQQRALLPEGAQARRTRYVGELGLTEYDAGVLTARRDVADYFEAVVAITGRAKEAANWVGNDLLRVLSGAGAPTVDELLVQPASLAALLDLVEDGTLHRNGAQQVLEHLLDKGGDPAEVARELGLEQVRDTGQIEGWCREVLQSREKLVKDVQAGNEKAVGGAIGPVMQASGGSADPRLVRETLLRLIAEEF